MNELKALKMKWPLIDEYVNDFKKLVRLAGYTLGNQETMGFFLEGLPMSPPLGSIKVNGAVVVREQKGDHVEPDPECEGCYES